MPSSAVDGSENIGHSILAVVESSISGRVKSRTRETDFSQIMKNLNARLRKMDCNLSFGGEQDPDDFCMES